MKISLKVVLLAASFTLALAALILSAMALSAYSDQGRQQAAAAIPPVINYQGFLTDETGQPVDGLVNLQFDLYKALSGGISLWSETHNGVQVNEGYFVVQLGSVSPLSPADFTLPAGASTLYVQVSIQKTGGGQVSLPRQPLGAVPYAFLAESAPWSGISGLPPGFADNLDDVEFDNLVTVAKSGGKFDSIQEAIDSITDATGDNRYLVWVAPGRYYEQVVLKPFVSLAGAGRWMTIIESSVGNADVYPPTEATLKVADYANVTDLTVINTGEGFRNVALLVPDGVVHTTINDVVALTNGPGQGNYGILVHGGGTSIPLENVSGRAESAEGWNVGLEVTEGATTQVHGGLYQATNGAWSLGITGRNEGTRLDLFDVTAKAADTGDGAMGLSLVEGAIANVHGGWFRASSAFTQTRGIAVWQGSALEAFDVYAIGLDSPTWNHGLTLSGGIVVLHSGSYHAVGGVESLGILNLEGGTLEGTAISAYALGASDRNDGLRNESGATSTVIGGFFRGRDGVDNRGVANYGTDSIIDLNQITAHAELRGQQGDVAFGVSNEDQGYAFITASELWGEANSLLTEGTMVRIHLSRLIGGPTGGAGDRVCLATTYAESFYAEGCP